MAKPTSCVLSEQPKVECARDECSHGDLGVRSGVIDLFPKDENRETEVSGFRFFLHTKKNRQLFGRIKRIAYLCSVNKTICVKLKHFNYGKLKTAKS